MSKKGIKRKKFLKVPMSRSFARAAGGEKKGIKGSTPGTQKGVG